MRRWHLVEGIDLWASVDSFAGQHVPQVNHFWLGEGTFLKSASQSFVLRCGKRYTGKAFYDRAAIEITCNDHSMLLRSARYYILFS